MLRKLTKRTMKTVESPKEIEERFRELKNEINSHVLVEDSMVPSPVLFEELDREFRKIAGKYQDQDDQLNLLHVEHNYLWSKSFQYLDKEPSKSLDTFVIALSKLIERNELRRYSDTSFEKMIATYHVLLNKIKKQRDEIEYELLEKSFIEFLESYIDRVSNSNPLKTVVIGLSCLILESYYDKWANDLKLSGKNYQDSVEFMKKITDIQEMTIRGLDGNPRQQSLVFQILYKFRKKQLHYWVRCLYFEQSTEKRETVQKEIDVIVGDMSNFSRSSVKYGRKFVRGLPDDIQNSEHVLLMMTLKDLDLLTAEYYAEAYVKKDILKAWHKMDEIKKYLVSKAFKENIQLSENLLRYYSEEWLLLYIFAKICLLKEETLRNVSSLQQEWEVEVFNEITENLQQIQGLFKYEIDDDKNYKLKIVTSSFSGGFSEYFIHELIQEYCEFCRLDNQTPDEFIELLSCAKHVGNKNDIILNDVVEEGKPDIDIHLARQCGIFLKNAKIESDEMKKLWAELELSKRTGLQKVFFLINFIKNVERIEYIRRHLIKMRESCPGMSIEIFDIKDVVGALLDELVRCGRSKLSFPALDLYRVLDY